jgi:hypothetical protein
MDSLESIPGLFKSLKIRARVKVVLLACQPILYNLVGRYYDPFAGVNFIPPVRDYELGYRFIWPKNLAKSRQRCSTREGSIYVQQREDNVTFIRGPMNVWNSKNNKDRTCRPLLKQIGKNSIATCLLLLSIILNVVQRV